MYIIQTKNEYGDWEELPSGGCFHTLAASVVKLDWLRDAGEFREIRLVEINFALFRNFGVSELTKQNQNVSDNTNQNGNRNQNQN